MTIEARAPEVVEMAAMAKLAAVERAVLLLSLRELRADWTRRLPPCEWEEGRFRP
jgi:hypothetical protein